MLDIRTPLSAITLALALAGCDAPSPAPLLGYELQVTPRPPAVVGQRSHLTLAVVGPDGARATRFEAHHGQAMHLIAATHDLEDLQHVHPSLERDGSFHAELDFGRPAPYALFAEVTPTAPGAAAVGQVLRATVWPAGAEPALARLDGATAFDGRAARSSTVQGTRFMLAPLEAPLRANVPVELSLAVDDGQGGPVELEEWTGMPVHAIALAPDLRQLLHFHGAFAGAPGHDGHGLQGHQGHQGHQGQPRAGAVGALVVHATFPAAGRYRLWLQVKRAGLVVTAPVVLEVSDPRPGA